jgi:hypothetical protein
MEHRDTSTSNIVKYKVSKKNASGVVSEPRGVYDELHERLARHKKKAKRIST